MITIDSCRYFAFSKTQLQLLFVLTHTHTQITHTQTNRHADSLTRKITHTHIRMQCTRMPCPPAEPLPVSGAQLCSPQQVSGTEPTQLKSPATRKREGKHRNDEKRSGGGKCVYLDAVDSSRAQCSTVQ
jgi:hypothetical protein